METKDYPRKRAHDWLNVISQRKQYSLKSWLSFPKSRVQLRVIGPLLARVDFYLARHRVAAAWPSLVGDAVERVDVNVVDGSQR